MPRHSSSSRAVTTGVFFRLVRSVLRNGTEAEDVVQETYVRAFAKLDDFKGPEGFSAWLARISRGNP
jgi:DNA-directed RNA polymerase specialized sigma24 family protein